jgi:hypothetical protein
MRLAVNVFSADRSGERSPSRIARGAGQNNREAQRRSLRSSVDLAKRHAGVSLLKFIALSVTLSVGKRLRRDRAKIHTVIERLLERPKFRPGGPRPHNPVRPCG